MPRSCSFGRHNGQKSRQRPPEEQDLRTNAVAEARHAIERDPLRADPRFQALLRRMNFPETASS